MHGELLALACQWLALMEVPALVVVVGGAVVTVTRVDGVVARRRLATFVLQSCRRERVVDDDDDGRRGVGVAGRGYVLVSRSTCIALTLLIPLPGSYIGLRTILFLCQVRMSIPTSGAPLTNTPTNLF